MGSNFVEGEASHIVSFDENQEDYFNNIDHSLPRLPSRSGSEATIVSHHQEVVNDGLNIDHFLSRRTSRLGSESEIGPPSDDEKQDLPDRPIITKRTRRR